MNALDPPAVDESGAAVPNQAATAVPPPAPPTPPAVPTAPVVAPAVSSPAPTASSSLFLTNEAPVGSSPSNPFSGPIYQASAPETAPLFSAAAEHSNPFQPANPEPQPSAPAYLPPPQNYQTQHSEPVIKPTNEIASYLSPMIEPKASEAANEPTAGFPFAEQPYQASGVNESNYMTSTPEPAPQAELSSNPFFRQVTSMRRDQAPPPSLEVPPPIAQPPQLDPGRGFYQSQDMFPQHQDPFQAPPGQDANAQQQPQPQQQQDQLPPQQPNQEPPQITDFEEEEADDTVKSINDALRGLFR